MFYKQQPEINLFEFLIEGICFFLYFVGISLIGLLFFYQKTVDCAESVEPFLEQFLEDLNCENHNNSGLLKLDYEINSRKSSISIDIEIDESIKVNTNKEKSIVESRPQSWWEWFFGSPKHTSPPNIIRTRESIKLEVGVAQLPPNKEKLENLEQPRSYKSYFNLSKVTEREEEWIKKS